MAKRSRRQGVSGNPAQRAQPTGSASTSSSGGTQDRRSSYVLGAVLVVAVLLVLFVLGPSGEDGPSGTAPDAVAPGDRTTSVVPEEVQTTGPPRRATDEEFCDEFVAMANSEAQFLSDGEAEELQRAADDLIAVGVPANMSLPARTGYFRLISSVYETIDLTLAPEAVGAVSSSVEGADPAFSAYLNRYCPA
jgi:hypothetical protein